MIELHDQDRVPDESFPDWHQEDKDDRDQGMDREPEPPDEQGEPPLDLVAARAVVALARTEQPPAGAGTANCVDLLDDAFNEIEALRRELAYWCGLPMRQEYAVTEGEAPDAVDNPIRCDTAEEAERFAGTKGHMWTRSLTEHVWVELVAEPPF